MSETGELADDAVLFGDSLLRSLSQGIGSAVGSPVAGLAAGALSSLPGIGIKLDSSNHLKLDEAVLDAKLVADLDAVRSVLEGDRTVASVAREFGINATTLGSWVNRHRIVQSSDQFGRFLTGMRIRRSVGRTGVCYDNAIADSFFSTIKNE